MTFSGQMLYVSRHYVFEKKKKKKKERNKKKYVSLFIIGRMILFRKLYTFNDFTGSFDGGL